jgi:hypothetical protein
MKLELLNRIDEGISLSLTDLPNISGATAQRSSIGPHQSKDETHRRFIGPSCHGRRQFERGSSSVLAHAPSGTALVEDSLSDAIIQGF